MNSPSQHVEERFLMHQIYDETRFVLYFLRYFYLPYSTMQYKNSICQNFCKRPKHFLLSERRSIESALQKTTNKILWGCWHAFLICITHPFPEELLAKKFQKWHFFGIIRRHEIFWFQCQHKRHPIKVFLTFLKMRTGLPASWNHLT